MKNEVVPYRLHRDSKTVSDGEITLEMARDVEALKSILRTHQCTMIEFRDFDAARFGLPRQFTHLSPETDQK